MAEGTPDLSGLLSGLLSNPSALSSMIGLLGGLSHKDGTQPATEGAEEKSASIKQEEGAPDVPMLPAFAPIEESGATGRRGRRERECLIGALSPYLSPERRRAAEGACKLLEVLELFNRRGER